MSTSWANSVYLGSSLGVKSLKCLEASVPNTSSTFLFIRANLKIKKQMQTWGYLTAKLRLQLTFSLLYFCQRISPTPKTPTGSASAPANKQQAKQCNLYIHWPALGQSQEKLPVWWSQILHFHHCLEGINRQNNQKRKQKTNSGDNLQRIK